MTATHLSWNLRIRGGVGNHKSHTNCTHTTYASMVSSVALGWRLGGLIQAGASTHRGLRQAPPAKAPGEWKTCEATRSALRQPQHVRCKRGRKGSGACGRPTFVVLVVDALQSFHFHLLFLIVLCASSTRHSPVGTVNFTQPSMHVPLMVVSLAIGRPVCPGRSPNVRHQSRTGERGAVEGLYSSETTSMYNQSSSDNPPLTIQNRTAPTGSCVCSSCAEFPQRCRGSVHAIQFGPRCVLPTSANASHCKRCSADGITWPACAL